MVGQAFIDLDILPVTITTEYIGVLGVEHALVDLDHLVRNRLVTRPDVTQVNRSVIALAQLICGVIMMLGVMRLVGINLNYVNAFVATMILGVGIDYSIHLVHRLTLSNGEITDGLKETGKADNTIVVIMGDNGNFGQYAPYSGYSPMIYRGGKADATEGGVRVDALRHRCVDVSTLQCVDACQRTHRRIEASRRRRIDSSMPTPHLAETRPILCSER